MNEERLAGLELGTNIETVFKVEPPLTKAESAFGYIGVLLRDIHEDTLQCHICGKWFKGLSRHVNMAHGMLSEEYKRKFSLPLTFPLIARSTSRKCSENALKPERLKALAEHRCNPKLAAAAHKSTSRSYRFNCAAHKNIYGICDKQLEDRYVVATEVFGRDLSVRELRKEDGSLLAAIERKFKTLNAFKKHHGFKVNKKHPTYNEKQLLATLKKFYKEKRMVPKTIHFKNSKPQLCTFLDHFGSWSRALKMAGITQ